MIPKEIVERIIDAAILAPSGENCQPWRFEADGAMIKIFNVPERDQSLYNFRQYGSLVAHGAAIENMVIAAQHLGYEAKVSLFPDDSMGDLVAVVSLEKSAVGDNPLFDAIFKRSTNRKPYANTPLTAPQRQAIFSGNDFIPGIGASFTEDKGGISQLADAVSLNERLVFENKNVHQFFFSHVRFTDAESEKTRNGFYVKTLELQPPQLKAMQILRNWNILNVLNKLLKVSQKIAAENAKIFKNSAAMGIITVTATGGKEFVNAGRVFQRIWLKATQQNISIQPLTGVLFFMRRIEANEVQGFTPRQIELIRGAYSTIRKTLNVREDHVALLFRLGDGGEPTARSPRMKTENFVKYDIR